MLSLGNIEHAAGLQIAKDDATNIIYYVGPSLKFFLEDAEKIQSSLKLKTKKSFKIEFVTTPLTTHTLSEKQLLDIVLPLIKQDPLAIVTPSMDIGRIIVDKKIPIQVITRGNANPRTVGIVDTANAARSNVTGYSYFTDTHDKRLELLRKLSPTSTRIGVLYDSYIKSGKTAANAGKFIFNVAGAHVSSFEAETLLAALSTIANSKKLGIDGWYIPQTPISYDQEDAKKIVAAVNAQNLPAIYDELRFVKLGGLAAYESILIDPDDIWIKNLQLLLEGVEASAIPFEYPRHFYFSINSDAIAKLGLKPPASVLKTVDYVYPCALKPPLKCKKIITKKY